VIYLLDACALITFLDEETGVDLVADLFEKANQGDADLKISSIQAIEVFYDRIYVKDIAYADTFLNNLRDSLVEIVTDIPHSVIREAGRIKATYSVSFADAVGLAAAKELGAQFVTSDHEEFGPLAKQESISFFWLPAHPKNR
jgi:predicted nucleic acid-binding protein